MARAFSDHYDTLSLHHTPPHGKWYSDLKTAQRFAYQIGAGFFCRMTNQFIAYRETKLESERIANGDARPA